MILLGIDLPNFATLMTGVLQKNAADALVLTRYATSLATASELDTSDDEPQTEDRRRTG